ncbi:unnamed protein product, partial [Symbiodinium sp. CCMP2592]
AGLAGWCTGRSTNARHEIGTCADARRGLCRPRPSDLSQPDASNAGGAVQQTGAPPVPAAGLPTEG